MKYENIIESNEKAQFGFGRYASAGGQDGQRECKEGVAFCETRALRTDPQEDYAFVGKITGDDVAEGKIRAMVSTSFKQAVEATKDEEAGATATLTVVTHNRLYCRYLGDAPVFIVQKHKNGNVTVIDALEDTAEGKASRKNIKGNGKMNHKTLGIETCIKSEGALGDKDFVRDDSIPKDGINVEIDLSKYCTNGAQVFILAGCDGIAPEYQMHSEWDDAGEKEDKRKAARDRIAASCKGQGDANAMMKKIIDDQKNSQNMLCKDHITAILSPLPKVNEALVFGVFDGHHESSLYGEKTNKYSMTKAAGYDVAKKGASAVYDAISQKINGQKISDSELSKNEMTPFLDDFLVEFKKKHPEIEDNRAKTLYNALVARNINPLSVEGQYFWQNNHKNCEELFGPNSQLVKCCNEWPKIELTEDLMGAVGRAFYPEDIDLFLETRKKTQILSKLDRYFDAAKVSGVLDRYNVTIDDDMIKALNGIKAYNLDGIVNAILPVCESHNKHRQEDKNKIDQLSWALLEVINNQEYISALEKIADQEEVILPFAQNNSDAYQVDFSGEGGNYNFQYQYEWDNEGQNNSDAYQVDFSVEDDDYNSQQYSEDEGQNNSDEYQSDLSDEDGTQYSSSDELFEEEEEEQEQYLIIQPPVLSNLSSGAYQESILQQEGDENYSDFGSRSGSDSEDDIPLKDHRKSKGKEPDTDADGDTYIDILGSVVDDGLKKVIDAFVQKIEEKKSNKNNTEITQQEREAIIEECKALFLKDLCAEFHIKNNHKDIGLLSDWVFKSLILQETQGSFSLKNDKNSITALYDILDQQFNAFQGYKNLKQILDAVYRYNDYKYSNSEKEVEQFSEIVDKKNEDIRNDLCEIYNINNSKSLQYSNILRADLPTILDVTNIKFTQFVNAINDILEEQGKDIKHFHSSKAFSYGLSDFKEGPRLLRKAYWSANAKYTDPKDRKEYFCRYIRNNLLANHHILETKDIESLGLIYDEIDKNIGKSNVFIKAWELLKSLLSGILSQDFDGIQTKFQDVIKKQQERVQQQDPMMLS